ncbi:MAG: hypothetical protein M1814_006105 [Vezdaea aestivalis]|nr:MAG: hypothetical protein M1814_006105 [Vezdaea aestivalis]
MSDPLLPSPSQDLKAPTNPPISQKPQPPALSSIEAAEAFSETLAFKATGNTYFSQSNWPLARSSYAQALALCPPIFNFDAAVIHSNIAAAWLKEEGWKDAVEEAGAGLTRLKKLGNDAGEKIEEEWDGQGGVGKKYAEEDVQRIKAKLLMRRAQARMRVGGWAALQGAEEDYKALETIPSLPEADARLVSRQLKRLPALITTAKETETAEMMGKLKDLGNGILKPFGLSTDNFKMTKDPSSGGYSMQFANGDNGGGSGK